MINNSPMCAQFSVAHFYHWVRSSCSSQKWWIPIKPQISIIFRIIIVGRLRRMRWMLSATVARRWGQFVCANVWWVLCVRSDCLMFIRFLCVRNRMLNGHTQIRWTQRAWASTTICKSSGKMSQHIGDRRITIETPSHYLHCSYFSFSNEWEAENEICCREWPPFVVYCSRWWFIAIN